MGSARAPWIAAIVALVMPALAVAKAAPFSDSVSPVSAKQLGPSYRPGCPVPPVELRRVSLAYIGFDGASHRGSLVVNEAVVPAVEHVFALLYRERFPIRRMEPIEAFGGSDNRSMAADNTSGFNCRYAVAAGAKHWSAHAYGEAIDVDPLENPYLLEGKVFPPGGRSYLNRSKPRRGMAEVGGELVEAFASAGWQWGGRWTGSPDYQHFSSTGG